MRGIVRFNWPLYLAAVLTAVTAIIGAWLFQNPWLRGGAFLAAGGSLYFLIVSLGVSHLIYDRSDLYRWRWLDRCLQYFPQDDILLCHSGFDEVSAMLGERYPATRWRILDHHERGRMSEASIRRARALHPPSRETLAAPFDCWPVPDASADAILGLLAIHELRSSVERTAWFSEAARCLKPGGRIVLAEHMRDWANFIAFGPGFLHFHSPRTWQCDWNAAGLNMADAFRVTPWVRVFILARPS